MGAPLEVFNGSSPSADFSTGANAIERFASFFAEDKGTHKVMESLTAAVVVKEADLTSPAVWIHASLMFETEYRLRHVTSEAEEEDFDFPHMSMVEKANIIQNAFIMVYTWLETQLPMPWNRSVDEPRKRS
ncbi:uncharacterized protein DNG_08959 [Cephalotrichum gorgonifer]|uniref:Uncharacterized protein n=1 Tax=Cephalotrichum gorgonifer TaxID=2041049 RepID=A0AAE8SYU7_9PEZI|nr:uncharacterized protein DNG_08959 [Cephalotrichum gorgonifer]